MLNITLLSSNPLGYVIANHAEIMSAVQNVNESNFAGSTTCTFTEFTSCIHNGVLARFVHVWVLKYGHGVYEN